MNIYTIYKATNVLNGKSYIGFDSHWPKRKYRHIRISESGNGFRFHDAIRKYGKHNFEWSILYQSLDQDHTLNEMESFFIKEYCTIEFGYNITEGGAGVIGTVRDTIWINDGVSNKRIRQDDKLPHGWSLGRTKTIRKVRMNEDSKKLIGSKNKEYGILRKLNSHKIPCSYCGMEMNMGNLTRHINSRHS